MTQEEPLRLTTNYTEPTCPGDDGDTKTYTYPAIFNAGPRGSVSDPNPLTGHSRHSNRPKRPSRTVARMSTSTSAGCTSARATSTSTGLTVSSTTGPRPTQTRGRRQLTREPGTTPPRPTGRRALKRPGMDPTQPRHFTTGSLIASRGCPTPELPSVST